MKPIRKVLIANRGEIAVRVTRTAKKRGVRTVAVFSDADAGALHVRCADEAVRIGPAESTRSYLSIEAIIEAARRTGADAVHPGYGFLSERAAFAEACETSGLVFIGPPASAIAAMGDKAESKRRMIAAGVPCIPGYQDEDQSDERLADEAGRIGFPVMLKASAGGGGRGQRVVHGPADLPEAIASARRESENSFGDGRLIVEKAVVGARHVEIQIMADAHGATLYLGERDCSMQRRRQKVIEEAPSPAITPAIRRAMGEAAVEAARAVGYRNAGTVEFLFDPATSQFYFLEMNTRLQVEHPVTECVTGLDLVDLQFDVAEGRPLPLRQDEVRLDGWAIEARLYAEDPAEEFLPQSGEARLFRAPQGPDVRVDAGLETGDRVSAFYDPMVAKIIAKGPDRDAARRRLASALRDTVLLGVVNNRDFLIALLEDEGFASGKGATDYIEANLARLAARRPPGGAAHLAVAATALTEAPFGALLTGWQSRGPAPFPVKLAVGPKAIVNAQITIDGCKVCAEQDGASATIEVVERSERDLAYIFEGRMQRACFSRAGDVVDIDIDGAAQRYVDLTYAPASEAGAGADNVKAPMAGAVTSIAVKPGDRVTKGQTLGAVEAMKMEHKLVAPRDGVVSSVHVAVGAQVAGRMVLVSLEPD
ncbi:MAG: ATP-grasp domain-containing protein [Parvularculaceae bacterium]|nr:ATP-grasp domain-containing protein [Parvularculaceae bacterium]